MIRIRLPLGALALCAGVAGFGIPHATAGFQFNAPVEEIEAAVVTETISPISTEALLPIIDTNQNVQKAPTPQQSVRPVIQWSDEVPAVESKASPEKNEDLPIVTPAGAPIISQPHNTGKPSHPPVMLNDNVQTYQTPTSQYEIAVGFGNNLPLISAMRQIIPADYTFTLGAGVKAGQAVSWQGGQEWPTVLGNAIAPLNLTLNMKGNNVHIINQSGNSHKEVKTTPPQKKEMIVDNAATDQVTNATETHLDDLKLDPSEREKTVSTPYEKYAMAQTTPDPVSIYDTGPTIPDIALSNSNTMDRLYISQHKRRPQILTQPSYEPSHNLQPTPQAVAEVTSSALPPKTGHEDKQNELIDEEISDVVVSEPIDIRPQSHSMADTEVKTAQIQPQIHDHEVSPPLDSTPIKTVPEKHLNEKQPLEVNETQELAALEISKPVPNQPSQIIPDIENVDHDNYWTAQSGSSLKTVLESWTLLEGVDLFWSSDYDFILAGDVQITGTFDEAIQTILSGFSSAKPKPIGRLHPNLPNGPAVLVIETRQSLN